jgi:hypothetical protein
MSRFSLAAGLCLLSSALALSAPAPKKVGFVPVDLQPKGNRLLSDNLHGYKDAKNDLGELKKGKHTLGNIVFEVGDKLIELGSKKAADGPEKVEGIAVGRTVEKLHFLHAAGYKGQEDEVIGKYIVHYEGGRKEEIDIVYGKDVHDWWTESDVPKVTRGKIVWEGKNEAVTVLTTKTTLQLFLMTWTNPHPRLKVTQLDFVSTQTDSAPFCVAVTAETK